MTKPLTHLFFGGTILLTLLHETEYMSANDISEFTQTDEKALELLEKQRTQRYLWSIDWHFGKAPTSDR